MFSRTESLLNEQMPLADNESALASHWSKYHSGRSGLSETIRIEESAASRVMHMGM